MLWLVRFSELAPRKSWTTVPSSSNWQVGGLVHHVIGRRRRERLPHHVRELQDANARVVGDPRHMPGLDLVDDDAAVAFQDLLRGADEIVGAELVHHLQQPLADDHGADKLHLVVHDVELAEARTPRERELPGLRLLKILARLHGRHDQPVGVGGGRDDRHAGHQGAAGIDDMKASSDPADELFPVNQRQTGVDVVVLGAAVDRIVAAEDIAVVDAARAGVLVIAELRHGRDHELERTGMTRQAPGCGDRVPLRCRDGQQELAGDGCRRRRKKNAGIAAVLSGGDQLPIEPLELGRIAVEERKRTQAVGMPGLRLRPIPFVDGLLESPAPEDDTHDPTVKTGQNRPRSQPYGPSARPMSNPRAEAAALLGKAGVALPGVC